MGGRGSSSATSKVGSTNAQQPTKAKSIENMNEAQLRQEIENAENLLQGKIKALKKYNGENVEFDTGNVFGERKRYNTARAVQNRTIREAREKERSQRIGATESRTTGNVFGERKIYNTARAVQNRTRRESRATEVRKEIEEIESRLSELNKALQQVSLTGKTIRQIKK